MTAEIIKLPYSVTRGAHSRKPRRSKNGTPEERAARAGLPATVVDRFGQKVETIASARSPSLVEFIQALRSLLVQELARGKDLDQIFDELKDTYRRAEVALDKFKQRRDADQPSPAT